MKGLRKVLTPFAPDQSGASGVLYSMGALIVIIDAGGCTGNVCGFDEPRWHESRSAIFSAGLRDMDAILGRDELLAAKIKSAVERIDTSFVAVIGTPVPATIGTDYKALKKLIAASSSGIDACEYLGRDFEIVSPVYKNNIPEGIKGKTLVCHDEVVGKTLRDAGVDLDIATFFKLHDSVKQAGDKKITEEDEFIEMVRTGGYDTIAADICLKELVPDYEGNWVDLKCFAISGRY